jgi:hypothetical protein
MIIFRCEDGILNEQHIFGLSLMAGALLLTSVGVHGLLSGRAFIIDNGRKTEWVKKSESPVFFHLYVFVMLALGAGFGTFGIAVFNHTPSDGACADPCASNFVMLEDTK